MRQAWRFEYVKCRFCKQCNVSKVRSKSGLCANCRAKFRLKGWNILGEPKISFEEYMKETYQLRRRKVFSEKDDS
jgi:hypothetical protein